MCFVSHLFNPHVVESPGAAALFSLSLFTEIGRYVPMLCFALLDRCLCVVLRFGMVHASHSGVARFARLSEPPCRSLVQPVILYSVNEELQSTFLVCLLSSFELI